MPSLWWLLAPVVVLVLVVWPVQFVVAVRRLKREADLVVWDAHRARMVAESAESLRIWQLECAASAGRGELRLPNFPAWKGGAP